MKPHLLLLLAVGACSVSAPAPRLAPDGPWDPHNVFARIQAGKLPAAVVYQDSELLVIMDHAPVSPGHVLVLSKTAHARDLVDVDPATLSRMMAMARRLVVAQRTGLGADGATVMINNGEVQSVRSLHIHVVPKYPGKPIDWAARSPVLKPQALEPVAEKLRTALQAQRP